MTNRKTCAICGTRKAKHSGCFGDDVARCHRCYMYLLRSGKERPTKIAGGRCWSCERPISHNRRHCGKCRSYKYRNGTYPSRQLVRKHVPHGYCECGKPATQEITLRTKRSAYTEWVCDECAALEQEMREYA